MKVLHVGQLIGGLDVYIRNSITYLDDSFEFVIVHGINDKNKPIIKNGVPIREYKISLFRTLNLWKDLKGLIQIIKIIRKEKPDIIHCHSAKGGFLGRIAGFMTGVKTFYTPHAFSFLCSSSLAKKRIFLFLERLVRLNSYLLACSESERQMGMDIVGYKPDRSLVWHNAVPDMSLKHGDIQKPKGKYICYIGRPCYQKNSFFLLDVIKNVVEKNPDLKFYLLGVGYHSPDLQQMKEMITQLDIANNIVLEPWLSQNDCLEYVRGSLLYLTVSRYEGLPLSVIEAMSLGKAIIASDVVGNKDCVSDGINGYLLPVDLDMFTDRIVELVNDEQKRLKFGRASRKLYLEEFQIEKQILKLEKIYKSR